MSLFFPSIMLLGNSQETEESVHYAGFSSQQNALFAVTMAKTFTVGDGERLVQVLFYMLLRFDNLQFSVDCPMAPVHPTRRVSDNLTHSAKSESLGDFTLMKRLHS